jgi:hypothetical protein
MIGSKSVPDLRVVAERSAKEIKKQKAAGALKAALADLAANLIRIVRGAGKPLMIAEQLHAAAKGYVEFFDAAGENPDAQLLGDLLRLPRPDVDHDTDQGTKEFYEYSILLAGLQKVASILKEQDILQAHANAEFQTRVRMYLDLREQIRKKRRAEMRKLAKPSPPKKQR